MKDWILRFFSHSRRRAVGWSLAIVVVVGFGDYVTGYEISFSIFYLLAIALAAWFGGNRFAIFISALSVIVGLVGDISAGASYSSRLVPAWNASITLAFYVLFVWLLLSLKSEQELLEQKVRQRTSALTDEMAKREQLEKELLAVSEREQQRIGHDLHDSLCQHLTATALAGQVLGEKLAAKSMPEVADASRVVELVEQGIVLARGLARGLFPVELVAEGLMSALHELAGTTAEISRIHCSFVAEKQVFMQDSGAAAHLFRIAQEAVRNAVKHSGASSIVIRLAEEGATVRLEVEDNGKGIASPLPEGRGMGLRIMRHRAAMIGAAFDIRTEPGRTLVSCELSEPPHNAETLEQV